MAVLVIWLGANAADAADPTPKDYKIEPQSVSTALKAFAAQSDMELIFTEADVGSAVTGGVTGNRSPSEALSQILKGTGLKFDFTANNVVVVRKISHATESAASKPIADALDPRGSSTVKLAQVDSPSPVAGEGARSEDERRGESQDATDSSKTKLDEIIVTGTHIRGVSPSSPIINITREEIDRSGYTSLGDLMRSLPQNYNGGNSPQLTTGATPGIDNGGSVSGGSSPNLRGLGSGSTLTLVNGHRLADDTINGAVDITLIPLAAVERVEVVTDGASAAYGSDAVAGVVNIILKKNYDGSETSILGGGTSQGGGTEKQLNQLLGKTWTTGNLLFDYEFDRIAAVYSTKRDYTLEAGTPTTLFPQSTRNSIYVSVGQDFGDLVSGFFDGLYTHRVQDYVVSYAGENATQESDVDVHQYSAAFGLGVSLPADWKLRPTVNLTEQRSVDVGTPTPVVFDPAFTYEGRTSSFELVADGPLVALPAGALRAAVGGGYRLETFADIEAGAPALVDAERRVRYVFAELAVPLFSPSMGTWIHKLDLHIGGREERYSDLGSQAAPQLGLAYSPVDAMKLRASWSKAYRAPPLFAQFLEKDAFLAPIVNPASPSGSSPALIEGGGNLNLRPETAKTWTVGVDYDPDGLKGLHLNATYYHISYINRIARIPTYFSALSDPTFAPFVTLSPSAALQQSVINAAGGALFNATGAPYDPSTVVALVNNELINVARQDIDGVDLTAAYKLPTYRGSLDLFANASYLDLRQQFVPAAPESEISGQVFEPSKIRARAGASWSIGPWAASGTVNFTGSEVNPYLPGNPHVASWTTFDAQINFSPRLAGALAGFHAVLSVQNLFDRDPPFLLFDQFVPGLHYDPTNSSVLGRFITLKLSKEFK